MQKNEDTYDDNSGSAFLSGFFQEFGGVQDIEPERELVSKSIKRVRSCDSDIVLNFAPVHSLWGHILWGSGKYIAYEIDKGKIDVRGKAVLDLGCGCGLTSIMASKCGAKRVLATDYPSEPLIKTLESNIKRNDAAVEVRGYAWGSGYLGEQFDIIFACDVIELHAAQPKLAESIKQHLKPDGCAIVAYTHNMPNKIELDNRFFIIAREGGLECEFLRTKEVELAAEGAGQTLFIWRLTLG